MVQVHYDKILEIAKYADMVVGNMEELQAFAGDNGDNYQKVFEKAFKKLDPKERLFVITDGSKGVFVGKYDYKRGKIDFILQSFPCAIKTEEISDLNGAGDAFLGGFLSQFMKGSSLYSCCRAGNEAAFIILKNVGCTYKNEKIDFEDQILINY